MAEQRAAGEQVEPAAGPEVGVDLSGVGILGRLAHDLRGPLAPLQTAAYLLRREDIDPQRQSELLDIIDRQTARLGELVQEVSDWMRARQSCLVGHREAVNVPMLIELACAELAALGGSIELPESLDDLTVLGDVQQLVQMLKTLSAYARSLGSQAGLRVAASRMGDRIRITVEQPGVTGVGDAGLDTLFSAPQASPFDDGLGLRLMIAQAVAHAHGGALSAHATDAGVELLLELPVAQ